MIIGLEKNAKINRIDSNRKLGAKRQIEQFTYSDFLVDEATNVFLKIVNEEKQNIDDYKEKMGFYG